jgi:hypothetical protein
MKYNIMAKDAKPNEVILFYAGLVLVDNRQSVLYFDGIWTANDTDTFEQIRINIKQERSTANNDEEVALTALTILSN